MRWPKASSIPTTARFSARRFVCCSRANAPATPRSTAVSGGAARPTWGLVTVTLVADAEAPAAPLRLRHPGHQRPQASRDRAPRERGALPPGGSGHPHRGLGLGPRHQSRRLGRGTGDPARPRAERARRRPPSGGTSTSTPRTASGWWPESRGRSTGASASWEQEYRFRRRRTSTLRPRGGPQLRRHRPVRRRRFASSARWPM